jgi:hypothetical protein
MAVERTTERLRTGLRVQGDDGQVIGTITDVWADVGVGESWGAVGALPIEGAEAADPVQYAFCEAMPGEGESYFRARTADGDLYIPFSYVSEVRHDTAVLSLAASDVPAMQWDVRPDFLATRSVPDSGAPSDQA